MGIANTKPERIHNKFFDELQEIRIERLINKLDVNPLGVGRLTLGLIRHPKWSDIKKDMKIAEMKNNRGQINFSAFNIFTIMIIVFITVLFFGGLIYVTGLLNNVFTNVGVLNEVNAGKSGYTNMTEASNNTFGKMNSGIQSLRLVALTLTFSLIIGFFITNAFIRVHPVFFGVYILIVILAVIFSASISNAYYTTLNSGLYDGLLNSFSGVNWIMLHLPFFIALIGILGGMFMFINIIKGTGEVLQ